MNCSENRQFVLIEQNHQVYRTISAMVFIVLNKLYILNTHLCKRTIHKDRNIDNTTNSIILAALKYTVHCSSNRGYSGQPTVPGYMQFKFTVDVQSQFIVQFKIETLQTVDVFSIVRHHIRLQLTLNTVKLSANIIPCKNSITSA